MNTPADDALRAELAGLLPPPEVPDLPPLRHQALKHRILNAAEGPSPLRGRRRLPRFAFPAVACTVAVTAVALTVVAGESPAPSTPVPRAGAAAPGPGQILSRAALAAAASPRAEARPEQFVYIESLVAFAARSAAGGPAALPPAHRRQVWLSADGSREGLLREQGGPDSPLGVRAPVYTLDHRGATPRPAEGGAPTASVTDPTHTYVASLPTDPEALLSLVYAQTRTTGGGDADQRAFTAIGTLLTETWAPPQVTAALYGAAARIPGTTVLPSAQDAAGREGVAVARTAQGEQTQWIFDRKTSAFLGQRTVLARATEAGPAGTVLGSSAVLGRGVTNRPGELPLGASAAPRA
ncbi:MULTISPECIES: CU044_5270 family protein [unclassified Streptomyces]|uniref:CU044_5270 family protein n=1 Tax=unclassified Streptomyces TaxID=2593676 RepID=UPI002E326873|nr:CU044_5270 family protein [Streptomyces sp. NBC_01268]